MCYSIPGRVEAIRDKAVTVDYFGEKKKALNEFFKIEAGDYVYAQGGFIIAKVPPGQAHEVLEAWRDVFFRLQEIDEDASRFEYAKEIRKSRAVAIFDKVTKGKEPSDADLEYLLGIKDEEELERFLKAANFLRQKYHGNACCVHGIIEISNDCKRNCHYCGISCLNRGLKRYRMTREEVLSAVAEAVDKHGFRALVLQSAEDCGYTAAELADMVREIRERHAALVFVSFGEVGEDGLKRLYDAGARGLLLRFETSNADLYRKFHPGYELETRLDEIRTAYRMGYMIATGALIGLPGQTQGDLINDIRLAGELNAEMFSFGPLVPHPGTPLACSKAPGETEVLKVLALSRFLAPRDAKVLVTTGFETIAPGARKKGLMSGASSVMLNATPMEYRSLYSIYPNRAHETETIEFQIEETITLLRSIGRAPTDLSSSAAAGAEWQAAVQKS